MIFTHVTPKTRSNGYGMTSFINTCEYPTTLRSTCCISGSLMVCTILIKKIYDHYSQIRLFPEYQIFKPFWVYPSDYLVPVKPSNVGAPRSSNKPLLGFTHLYHFTKFQRTMQRARHNFALPRKTNLPNVTAQTRNAFLSIFIFSSLAMN